MSAHIYDAVIIGKGPAGVSASVYIQRSGFSSCLVGKDEGAMLKASKIENYYGFPDGISGKELFDLGIRQALSFGADIYSEEIISADFDGSYFVFKSGGNEFKGRAAVLACGVKRINPLLKNFSVFEGRGVSRCAVCDAFFFKGMPVGVLGSREYASSEASVLLPLASSVTVLSDGAEFESDMPEDVIMEKRKIKSLYGDDRLEGVVFEDGEKLELRGLFVAFGSAGAADFALKLGAFSENGRIFADDRCSTGIPGLFAAGDCTGRFLQIAGAVYEGAVAGSEAVKYIKSLK